MAIKTISKLESFDNNSKHAAPNPPTAISYGGKLKAYLVDTSITSIAPDLNSSQCNDPNASTTDTTNTAPALTVDTTTYTQTLFEVSKPIANGTLASEMYETKKITYDQLASNIILDIKQYLNTKNNIKNVNIYALANGIYDFNGDKTFSGNVDIEQTLDITGDTKIYTGNFTVDTGYGWFKSTLTCHGKATFEDNVLIDKSLTANIAITRPNILTCDANGLTVDTTSPKTFQATGALTANSTGVTIKPNTTIETGNFTVLTGTTSLKNTNIVGTVNVTGDVNVSNKLTANAIQCNGLTCDGSVAHLTALYALWADIAECYLADDVYEPGTLVKFGGKNEVTKADKVANAVVSTNPAYLMHSSLLSNDLACKVVFVGKVPVKIQGKIQKFDNIVAADNGYARRLNFLDKLLFKPVLGKALESKIDEDVKTIECVVKIKL